MQSLNNLCLNCCSFNSAQNILNIFLVFAGFLSLRNILLFSKADLNIIASSNMATITGTAWHCQI